jgi:hypothetical protein
VILTESPSPVSRSAPQRRLPELLATLQGAEFELEQPIAGYELDRLAALLRAGRVRPREVLDAWNLLADVAASSPAAAFEDTANPRQLGLYNRLFFAMNLPAMTPAGARFRPRFGHADTRYLQRLMTRGIAGLRRVLGPWTAGSRWRSRPLEPSSAHRPGASPVQAATTWSGCANSTYETDRFPRGR